MSAEEIALAQKVSEQKQKQTSETEAELQAERGPRHWQFRSIDGGVVLARNATGSHNNWEILSRSGKWQPGANFMGPYIFKGEPGDEDVGEDEARDIARKLGGTIDGAVASKEEIRAMQAEWDAEYGD